MSKRPHSHASLSPSHAYSGFSSPQENQTTRSTEQLPALLPLPVFRVSAATNNEVDKLEQRRSSHPAKSQKFHTLATLLLFGKKAERSKSFEDLRQREEDFKNQDINITKRQSLPCTASHCLLPRNRPTLFRQSATGSGSSVSMITNKDEIIRNQWEQNSLTPERNGTNARKSIRRSTAEIRINAGIKRSDSRSLNASIIRNSTFTQHDGELNEHELNYLQYSADGKLKELKEVFEQQTYYLYTLNVNCVDSLDRTALSLATLNRHIEIVKFLLSEEIENIHLGDALFFAIQCEFYEAIEVLLEKDPQTGLQVMPGTTSPFEPGLTPFMLAAHKNNYKILAMLYKYSHRLTFSDNELLLDEGFDPYSWDAVMERLLHYRARASPAFMLLMYNERGMSWDPLNTAMDLFGELQELARREREVDESYLQMAETCETFAMELLMQVRSANELADFMRYDLEDDDSADLIDEVSADDGTITPEKKQKLKYYLKPIEKGVKCEMKDFVTSDNSQLALIYIQKGKLFRRLKGFKATIVQIVLGMMFPILSIAFLIAPKSKLGRLMANPTVKFWCWLMSEVVFVVMLLVNTIMMHYNVFDGLNSVPPLLIVAYFWILGKFIQELREIVHQGLRQYLSDIWNWNDMFTIVFYTAFVVFRSIHILSKNNVMRGEEYWTLDSFNVLPLSDICIAISYVLIHMRIMELLRAERTFGPLQVSLDLMLGDTFRFLVIFSIVFLAFGSGITELYTPFATDKNCTCNDTMECDITLPMVDAYVPLTLNSTLNNTLPACVSCKKSSVNAQQLTNFYNACIGLYWTLFGYGQPVAWYEVSNCPEKFALQEMAGMIIVGIYHFAAIIVLVNMLIAMMSNSFQKTHDDSEREWKFHRTELWLKFIRDEINRPPPMNLIPRWKVIKMCWRKFISFLRKIFCKTCVCNDEDTYRANPAELEQRFRLNQRVCASRDSRFTLLEGETRYSKVVRLVVLRYVRQKVLKGEMVMN